MTSEGPCSVYWKKRTCYGESVEHFLETYLREKEAVLFIECEVNNYDSVKLGHFSPLYNNAEKTYIGKDIYLICITQYTAASIDVESDALMPQTIEQFEQTKTEVENHENLFHVYWEDIHVILSKRREALNIELSHIVFLHKNWIRAKNRKDFQDKGFEVQNSENN